MNEEGFGFYSLIQYWNARYETKNLGVILVNGKKIDYTFYPHSSIDYRKWKEFFEKEIHGPAVPGFMPEDRSSSAFLRYLHSSTAVSPWPLEVVVTKGMVIHDHSKTFEEVLIELDNKYVEKPEIVQSVQEPGR